MKGGNTGYEYSKYGINYLRDKIVLTGTMEKKAKF